MPWPGLLDGSLVGLEDTSEACDVGENISAREGHTAALEGNNVKHDEVTMATKKALRRYRSISTVTEIGTQAYMLHSLLGLSRPLFCTILSLVD